MAKKDHVRVVQGGAEKTKEWRKANPNETLDLRRSDLTHQDLTQADLREADLEFADLRWVDAVGAKFDGAKLIRTDFHKADLTGASFSHAKLTDTNFEDANLTEASFEEAEISGTRFLTTDLSTAKGLENCIPGKPSTLDRETLNRSGDLPLKFLRACGIYVPYRATVYRVVVASPGDVAVQRELVRNAIYTWNDHNSKEYGTVLLPVLWERHSTPALGDHPQSILNKQIIDTSDILIGIFWSRLGTPTPEAVSGTVSEIQRCREAGKRVLLYFSQAPLPHNVDTEQLTRLREFKEAIQKTGLIDQFETNEELEKKVQRHLTNVVQENFGGE